MASLTETSLTEHLFACISVRKSQGAALKYSGLRPLTKDDCPVAWAKKRKFWIWAFLFGGQLQVGLGSPPIFFFFKFIDP